MDKYFLKIQTIINSYKLLQWMVIKVDRKIILLFLVLGQIKVLELDF